jgi:hypothetical protein
MKRGADPLLKRIVSTIAEVTRAVSRSTSCHVCGGAPGTGTIWVVFKDEVMPGRCPECEAYLTPEEKRPVDLVYWLRDRSRALDA